MCIIYFLPGVTEDPLYVWHVRCRIAVLILNDHQATSGDLLLGIYRKPCLLLRFRLSLSYISPLSCSPSTVSALKDVADKFKNFKVVDNFNFDFNDCTGMDDCKIQVHKNASVHGPLKTEF